MDTNFGSYNTYKSQRISAFIIDEIIIQIEDQNSGYGYVSNKLTNLCLESIFQKKKHVCSRKFYSFFSRYI